MYKMCKKGLKSRFFFLFNDMLVYGSALTKGKFKGQSILPLVEMSISDVEDSAEGSNGFQINHKQKSFIVYANSLQDKTEWLSHLRRFIKLSRVAQGLPEEAEVDARSVWVPDAKVCPSDLIIVYCRCSCCSGCSLVVRQPLKV